MGDNDNINVILKATYDLQETVLPFCLKETDTGEGLADVIQLRRGWGWHGALAQEERAAWS